METSVAAVDQSPVVMGANEEVAGPAYTVLAPTTNQERISTLDVLRGISLMGILVMNITDFAYGFENYMFPLTTMKPVFSGPHWMINTALWFARWIFAEGKMRGLFSMLFGAGIVVLTERAARRGAGVKAADIYTRRNMWLVLFGMIHAYFIWAGDILFFYGVAALLFLFPFRVVKAKKLLWAAGIILLINTLAIDGGQFMSAYFGKKKADAANAKLAQHKVLTEEDVDSLKSWSRQQESFRPSEKKRAKDIAAMQKGYWGVQGHRASDVMKGQLKGAYFGFPDWVGMMLLGMALFKNGFLKGDKSNKVYAWTAAIGLGIGWPLIAVGAYKAWHGHFDFLQTMAWMQIPYGIGRVAGAVGNAALIILFVKNGLLKPITRAVANVGQMALSNYLLTSITMSIVFAWGPWHWYMYVEYYKVYIAMACMWTFNLIFSAIWLKSYRFGPFEWAWRSLTYWKRQPMRLQPKADSGEGSAATA